MLIYLSLLTYFVVAVTGTLRNETTCPSPIQKHPYVISIEFENLPIGGGSIISRYFILTSASIVYDKIDKLDRLTVRSGSSYSNKHGYVHNVCDIIVHPDWTSKGQVDNAVASLAIIRLVKPISFDVTRQPIGWFSDDDEVLQDKSQVIVSAWSNIFQPGNKGSNPLQINETIVRDCNGQSLVGEFCIEKSFTGGIYEGCLGRGHPVVIDGMQAGIIVYTDYANITFITDLVPYSSWIYETLKKLSGIQCEDGNKNESFLSDSR